MPDEGSPVADRFWSEVRTGAPLHVPPLWWYECANALVVARRRERLTEDQAAGLGGLLGALPVRTASRPAGDDLARLQELAGRHGLSAYDAAYLDLARRLVVGLATLDERLAEAGRAEHIDTFAG
jgi:predicted nucleic acid-binding protein